MKTIVSYTKYLYHENNCFVYEVILTLPLGLPKCGSKLVKIVFQLLWNMLLSTSIDPKCKIEVMSIFLSSQNIIFIAKRRHLSVLQQIQNQKQFHIN